MALACQKKSKVPEPAEGETAVSRWKTPPPIMQHMMVFFSANLKRDKLMVWCPWFWFTPRDQIRPRPSHRILDQVRYKKSEDERYEPPEDCDVRFVRSRLEDERPYHEGSQRDAAGIYEEPGDGNAFDFGVRVLDGEVI